MEDDTDQSEDRFSRRTLLKSAGVVGGLTVGIPVSAKSQTEQDDDVLGVFTEYEVEFFGRRTGTATTTAADEGTVTAEETTTVEATTTAEEASGQAETRSLFYDGGIDLLLFQGFPLPVSSVQPLEGCDWSTVELGTFSDADDFLRLVGLIEPTEMEPERLTILDKRDERVLRCQP